MELITQNALIPGTPPRSWLCKWDELHYLSWEWELVESVTRPTENAALRRIFKQARIKSKPVIPMMTPALRYALELEWHYMREFSHWDITRIRQEMANKMRVTPNKVKAILEHADTVCAIYTAFGWKDPLN